MRVVVPSLLALVASGCWKDELAEIPPDVLQFQPEVEAPLGWLVEPVEVNLECPDGEKTRFYLMYPEDSAGQVLPVALLLHSGSWDFVFAPDPQDPLTGTHFADPSRLTSEWAVRQVFATLGMYPEQDDVESHQGLLPTALAEEGVAVMLPANCWGDLWANKRGGADNDFAQDFFFREGRAAVEWGYRFLVDPLFADAFDVVLPIEGDPTQMYAIGLGEGARGVLELAAIDNDADGQSDYPLAGALLDSAPDDLRLYLNDPGLYASTVEGLGRLYPSGPDATRTGSVWGHPSLPPRVGYVYSSSDPTQPVEIHAGAVDRLGSSPTAWVLDADRPDHVLLNGGNDISLAREAVQFLLTGSARR